MLRGFLLLSSTSDCLDRSVIQKHSVGNYKLAKRVLGQDTGRKVFGFRCAPDISAELKKTADGLHVPVFAVAEHCLQLGAMAVREACEDPAQTEELRNHLVESHVEQRTIEKIARYDKEASEYLEDGRLHRFSIEQLVRRIVGEFSRSIKPEDLEDIFVLGYATKVAIDHGWQPPPSLSRNMGRYLVATPVNRAPDDDKHPQGS